MANRLFFDALEALALAVFLTGVAMWLVVAVPTV